VGRQAMIEFKGSHFEREVILWGVRWYVAYPISYRQLEEMMDERGVKVDHSTLNRWVVKYVPLLEKQFRSRKRPVGSSWRLDETYVKVKGAWKYLYRAVDKAGATVDFLMTAKRDRKAALRFLRKASITVHLRRSQSTRAVPIRRRSKVTTPRPRLVLRCARSNISTTLLSRTTGPSSGRHDRCSGSNPSGQPPLRWPGSRSCT
jgi:hypothetical protein